MFIMCTCSSMISITFESFIIQIEFAKCPFSIFTKNEKKLKRKNYDKYGRLPNLQLLISLFFATEKKKKEGIDTIQLGKVYRIYLAMSNQLSAFCGCISGFWDLCPWQQTAGKAEKTFITCILQPVHFVGEMRMRGSFQCLTKPMTWRLLHETLWNQNNYIRPLRLSHKDTQPLQVRSKFLSIHFNYSPLKWCQHLE